MNISKIISGNNVDKILYIVDQTKKKLSIDNNSPDLYEVNIISGQSIGIEQIKDLIIWSNLKPFQSLSKLIIINNAESLTLVAQNSLLKLLEEPNQYTNILLITKSFKLLLPTIISRCQIYEYNNLNDISNNNIIDDFINLSILDKLKYVENLLTAETSEIINKNLHELFVSLLKYYRNQLFHNNYNKNTSDNIELIFATISKIQGNVSKKIALENLVFNLK
jgi:DNA polymerase III delta prime subunit